MKKLLLQILAISITYISTYTYSYLPDNMPLNKVLFLSAHNSAQAKAYGWRYYQHLDTLESQWKNGVRGAKINLHWRYPICISRQLIEEFGPKRINSALKRRDDPNKKPFIALAHEADGNSNCFLSAVIQKSGELDPAINYLKSLVKLIQNNPKDIFFLILEDYLQNRSYKNRAYKFTPEEARQQLIKLLNDSGISKYSYKSLDNFNTMPTVGDLRKTNKRIIIFCNDQFDSQNDFVHYYSKEFISSTFWQYDWENDLNSGTCRLWEPRSDPMSKFFIISAGPEMSISNFSKKGRVLNFFQKLGFPSKIRGHIIKTTDYKKIHSKQNILKRIHNCEKSNGSHIVNVLGLDFISIAPEEEKLADTIEDINISRAKELGLSLNL